MYALRCMLIVYSHPIPMGWGSVMGLWVLSSVLHALKIIIWVIKKSRYKADIDTLQISNTANGTSFCSLFKLCNGLERLDRLQGLPYASQQPTKTLVIVASVTDASGTSSSSEYEMHQESWIGAINLTEEQGHKLWSMFQCPQCHSNSHTLPTCPLMKHWTITKK